MGRTAYPRMKDIRGYSKRLDRGEGRGGARRRDWPESGQTAFPSGGQTCTLNRNDYWALQCGLRGRYPACFQLDGEGRGYYGPGRIVIESCSTKIVLKQDRAASKVLKEAFDLGDGEKFIVNAKSGQGSGILVTQEGRIPFYNFLSGEERNLFTTKPKEISA